MASKKNGTLYVGVTGDLRHRVYLHKQKETEGFTKIYNLTNLVYFKEFQTITDAICREKFLKKQMKTLKMQLIEEFNPLWQDLFDTLL